jgi:hypothetical protein
MQFLLLPSMHLKDDHYQFEFPDIVNINFGWYQKEEESERK